MKHFKAIVTVIATTLLLLLCLDVLDHIWIAYKTSRGL